MQSEFDLRLSSLKKILKDQKIDFFILPNSDEFFSEYLPENQKRIQYLTGFSGSNAILIIGEKKSFFFTDGRYTLQARNQLDLDEFEEADYDRKEEMLDEARENVYNEYYDNWYEGLDDPYTFLVEEQGLYDDESFVKANFVQVDYEKLADALEQDYTFIRHDGKVYVFNIR
jgi:Xaa-Pro aminopeptidase